MAFFQSPPSLGNQYLDDRMLRGWLERTLPPEVLAEVRGDLERMGDLAGGELYRLQLEDRLNEPRLVQWDPWGHRVDRIEQTPLWRRAAVVAAEEGLVAAAYERRHGAWSRVVQHALVYLFDPSSDVYTCPLAMTDGAAKTLLVHGNRDLVDRALPRLTSRDPARMWTSGQWMTERTGGSDVAISETVARRAPEGHRLYGTKWFTSAATSEMALTLARPEGNPPGGAGLALYYLETRGADGRLNGIRINRLKEKLGTRKLPTAELELDGALAVPVCGTRDGIRAIGPMLNVTRTWNAVCSVAAMRRAIALARDYATRRIAFGAPLSEKALHVDTLAGLEAEFEGAFLLAFAVVELMGREEAGAQREGDAALLRLLTPLAKLCIGRQVVEIASEAIEAFGGAGYIEDTGLPRLLRDAQVLSIWEGTTNVLSLDVLRALAKPEVMQAYEAEAERRLGRAEDAGLGAEARAVRAAIDRARRWLEDAAAADRDETEAGARRLALTLARTMELAVLVDHAAWERSAGKDGNAAAAARRFARHGVDRIAGLGSLEDSRRLAGG
ncbi:MAG TPA: acyl-CoA dehydrogenase family protein [Vulgatibacter sp.]|nr:acyl-CoA dehydrogenase family protein [Vulgatibacter sp.]